MLKIAAFLVIISLVTIVDVDSCYAFGSLKDKIQYELDGNPFLKKQDIKLRVTDEANGYVTIDIYQGNRKLRESIHNGADIMTSQIEQAWAWSGSSVNEKNSLTILRKTIGVIQKIEGVKEILLTASVDTPRDNTKDTVPSNKRESSIQAQPLQNAGAQTSSGRHQNQSIAELTYSGAVAQRVKSFWVLPEMRKWDASLLAQVVIAINKDGAVINIQFDQRSRDPLFDQLVEKTINSAAPMPRFPALMQQETTEVRFRLKPGVLDIM